MLTTLLGFQLLRERVLECPSSGPMHNAQDAEKDVASLRGQTRTFRRGPMSRPFRSASIRLFRVMSSSYRYYFPRGSRFNPNTSETSVLHVSLHGYSEGGRADGRTMTILRLDLTGQGTSISSGHDSKASNPFSGPLHCCDEVATLSLSLFPPSLLTFFSCCCYYRRRRCCCCCCCCCC